MAPVVTAQIFTPSLAPNSILSVCFPSHLTPTEASTSISASGSAPSTSGSAVVVKQFDLGEWNDEYADRMIGMVRRIARGKGKGRASDDEEGRDQPDWLAIADSTNHITLTRCPPPPSSAAYMEDTQESRTLQIVARWKVQGVRRADKWVGLDVLATGILSTLSSGLVTLHPFPTSQPILARAAHLPSPLTCLQPVSLSNTASISPMTVDPPTTTTNSPLYVVAAGKEVDVGIWDLERLFSPLDGPGIAVTSASAERESKTNGQGQKRKKGRAQPLGEGQVWGGKNLPNNTLSLRVPIHHLSLAVLPAGQSTAILLAPGLPHLRIITGTQNGHLRLYDTRERRPKQSYKLSKPTSEGGDGGGIGVVCLGRTEGEVFYSEGSALFGSMDLRTGRTMYKYATGSTSTAQALLTVPPAPHSSSGPKGGRWRKTGAKEVALVSVGSDATLRICSSGGIPKETKGNVIKGEVLTTVGAIGVGNVVFGGWYQVDGPDAGVCTAGTSDAPALEGDDGEGADVWDDLEVVRGEDEDDDSEVDSDDQEEEAFRAKRRKQEGRS